MSKTALFLATGLLATGIFAGTAHAASGIPGWDADPGPGAYSGTINSSAYPPSNLPNGAINLDDVWTQDGGARMYWNSTRYPIQLKLAGQTWVDPALVPDLFPTPAPAPKKRAPVKRANKPRQKVICFPADQVPEALRPKKKTAPVARAKPAVQKAEAKPRSEPDSAQTAHRPAIVEPAPAQPAATQALEQRPDEDTSVTAPRLQ